MADIEIPAENPDDYWRKLLQKKVVQDNDKQQNAITETFDNLQEKIDEQNKINDSLTNMIGKVYTATFSIVDKKENYFDKIKDSLKILNKDVKLIYSDVQDKLTNFAKSIDTWRKAKSKELAQALVMSKGQQQGMDIYEGLKKSIGETYEKVTTTIKTISSPIIYGALAGLEFGKSCLSCMSTFIFGVFKIGWKIVDSFLTMIGGPIWSTIKSFMGMGVSVAKWVISIGMDAIDFIWSGVKTIFSFTFGPIITASKYLIKGAKIFFDWWLGALFNSLFSFSPINLLLWSTITGAVFFGLGALLIGTGVFASTILQPIFSGVLTVGKVIGDWIWSGITTFFEWIKKQYNENSIFKETVDSSWKNIGDTFNKWFGGPGVINKVFGWIGDTWNWLEKSGKKVFKKINEQIQNITNFIQSTPTGTLLSGFIKFLEKHNKAGILTPVISMLKDKFGVSTSGQLNVIRGQIKTQKYNTMRDILEHNILQMKKDNYSSSQIEDKLNNQIIPKLSEAFDLSSEDTNKAVQEAYKTAQDAYEGKVGLVDARFIQQNLDRIIQLENSKAAAYRGDIDQTGQKELQDFLEKNQQFIDTESLNRFRYGFKGGTLSRDQADNLVNEVSSFFEKSATESHVPTYNQFAEIRDEEKDNSNIASRLISSDASPRTLAALSATRTPISKISDFGNGGGLFSSTIQDLMDRYFFSKHFAVQPNIQIRMEQGLNDILTGDDYETSYNLLINLINSVDEKIPGFGKEMSAAAREALKIRNPSYQFIEKRFANGGIITPMSINKIMPLDEAGQDFIKNQVKEIKLPEAKKTASKEEIRNITIIEESVAQKESYQIYTMSQMAKGILGV